MASLGSCLPIQVVKTLTRATKSLNRRTPLKPKPGGSPNLKKKFAGSFFIWRGFWQTDRRSPLDINHHHRCPAAWLLIEWEEQTRFSLTAHNITQCFPYFIYMFSLFHFYIDSDSTQIVSQCNTMFTIFYFLYSIFCVDQTQYVTIFLYSIFYKISKW